MRLRFQIDAHVSLLDKVGGTSAELCEGIDAEGRADGPGTLKIGVLTRIGAGGANVHQNRSRERRFGSSSCGAALSPKLRLYLRRPPKRTPPLRAPIMAMRAQQAQGPEMKADWTTTSRGAEQLGSWLHDATKPDPLDSVELDACCFPEWSAVHPILPPTTAEK